MGLFRFRWFHRFIRRHTNPIEENTAAKWKHRMSLAYMVISLNILGVMIYLKKGKTDPSYYGLKSDKEINQAPGVYYSELLGIKKAHVILVKGLTKVAEYDYVNENLAEERKIIPKSHENK